MTKQNSQQTQRENFATESPIVAAISELTGSLLKLAQERIIERIEATAHRITHNIVMMLTVVFLGLTGLIFMLTGFSIWLGTVSEFGIWFGLLVTGITIFIVALIIALTQKNNK
ncbi:MAG: hypothetical protein CR972_03605 [Candidatus Moraniibacteriota bacterium]|nr:MAG: hypothetical protein CR972_03605 [Candidatus Moranbacteria bacterium]